MPKESVTPRHLLVGKKGKSIVVTEKRIGNRKIKKGLTRYSIRKLYTIKSRSMSKCQTGQLGAKRR
jgi:hypothetical protein